MPYLSQRRQTPQQVEQENAWTLPLKGRESKVGRHRGQAPGCCPPAAGDTEQITVEPHSSSEPPCGPFSDPKCVGFFTPRPALQHPLGVLQLNSVLTLSPGVNADPTRLSSLQAQTTNEGPRPPPPFVRPTTSLGPPVTHPLGLDDSLE